MSNKILIVDDSSFMCKTVRDILTANGYETVEEANNGEQALLKSKELMPDLVILDLILSNENGLDVLKKLKKENPKIKVLVLTAVSNQAVVVEVAQVGVKGFLNKPFQSKTLIDEIRKILKD